MAQLISHFIHVKAKAFGGVYSINPTLKRGVIKYDKPNWTLVPKNRFLEMPLINSANGLT